MANPPSDTKHPANSALTDLVTAATADADATLLLVPPEGTKPQRISKAEAEILLNVDDAQADATAAKTKTDQLTVTAATDLDDIRVKTAAHNVKLLSEVANLETDWGLTPNAATSRQTLESDPGGTVAADNRTAMHAGLSGWNAVPSVAKVLVTPPGTFSIAGPLDTTTYKQAFNNLTWRGARSEYYTQLIEVGSGQIEWASRINVYNDTDDDFFIDLPGGTSYSDWPGNFTLENMVWALGDFTAFGQGNTLAESGNLSGAEPYYATAKGSFLRIGDRDNVGSQASQPSLKWNPLARGVRLAGMQFTDWILSKSNRLYKMIQYQADGSHLLNWKKRGLNEFHRVYDLTIEQCAYRGGLGPAIWMSNCDSPLLIAPRMILVHIGILNACTQNDPSDPAYDRDFMVDDGVTARVIAPYIEQPFLAGIVAAGGIYGYPRIEGGYANSYPDYSTTGDGPGRYEMPSGVTWAVPFNDLASSGQAEQQYVQFSGITSKTVVPYYNAGSRAAKLSDYVIPGMVLELTPATPNAYGYRQRPVRHVLITAIDDTNSRAYFFGGYRNTTGTGIGTSFVGRSTTGDVITGDATQCIRLIGIPFVGGGSRLAVGPQSITQNATPQPPVPRYALTYDRAMVTMGPYAGGVGAHDEEQGRQDPHRGVICASCWGGKDQLGGGVAHIGVTPPRHHAAKIIAGEDLDGPPRSYRDFRLPRPESFDFYASPKDAYIYGNGGYTLEPEMLEEENGDWVPGYCPHDPGALWKPFDALPAATYDWTARIWSPRKVGHKQAASAEERTTGDHTGKLQVNFSTDQWYEVGESITLGGTGVTNYNDTFDVLEVVDSQTIVVDVAHEGDVAIAFDTFIDNTQRFILNFRQGAGDGTGVSQLWPTEPGINYGEDINDGWTTITGTSPSGTTDVWAYAGALKLYRIAWIGLTAQ